MTGDNVVFIVQLHDSRLDCHLMVIAVVVGGGRSDYNSINPVFGVQFVCLYGSTLLQFFLAVVLLF